MVTSGTVYIFLFTLSNLSLTLYLQHTLKMYRQRRELPRWVRDGREFLEKLDDVIKSTEIRALTEEIPNDPLQPKNFIENLILSANFSPLSFLQLSPAPETNIYDMRDDYQVKRHEKEGGDFYDPSKFQDDLVKTDSDSNLECNLNDGVSDVLNRDEQAKNQEINFDQIKP